MRADGEIQAVILLFQLVKGDVAAHVYLRMNLDAKGEDGVDIVVQPLAGQAVAGDAVTHHAAQLLFLFIDGDLMAHQCQIVGGGKTAGAAADNGDGLSCFRGFFRVARSRGVIHGVTLQPSDVQRIVHHVPPAPGLAGVLADIGAGCWEGVVLTDELNRVVAAARVDQSDVTGNIHPGGTQRHAGHGVFETAKTPVMENVLLVIVPKALQPH